MSRNAPYTRQCTIAGAAGALLLCLAAPAADSLTLQPAGPHARVVAVRNPQATGELRANADVVEAMVNTGLTNLTGKPDVAAAWTSLVSTNDIVGIKVYTVPGPNTGTRPQVAAAVVKGLLAAGFPTNHIIVWDRHAEHLQRAGYAELATRFGITVEGAAEAGFDEQTYYDKALLGSLIYGDLEFGRKGDGVGRKSFVSKLVSQRMTRIINIAPVANHNGAGVAGNLYSLAMGSVDNLVRFEGSRERLAMAVPEIYALPSLSDRVVLNISDALICQYEGEDRGLLHYSAEQNEIRLSRDPVALDVLALADLDRLRRTHGQAEQPVNLELYKNAALLELGVAEMHRIDVTTLKQ